MDAEELLRQYATGRRNFNHAELSKANLSGADLSGANLSGADLSGADLSGVNLSETVLRGSNLSGANLDQAILHGAILRGANLQGVRNFSKALYNEATRFPVDFDPTQANSQDNKTLIQPEQLDNGRAGAVLQPPDLSSNQPTPPSSKLDSLTVQPPDLNHTQSKPDSRLNTKYPPQTELFSSTSPPMPAVSNPQQNRNSLFRAIVLIAIITVVGGGFYWLWHLINPPNSTTFYKKLANVPNVPQGTFRYGGSTSVAPLRSIEVVSAIRQAHPQFNIQYYDHPVKPPSSGLGIEMLLEDQLSFSESSRPVKTSEFEEAEKRGFKLEQKAVAIDGIAIYVNRKLPIPGLTLPQVQDIFTGRITNWREVGGPNRKITVFSRNKASGTVEFFYKDVLGEQAFSPTMQEVQTPTESIRRVARTLGGIGYATASEIVDQRTVPIRILPLSRRQNQNFVSPFSEDNVNAVNAKAFNSGAYPITRKLFIVIKRDGSLDEQAGLAYYNLLMSDEGQRLVRKKGFMPVRAVD